MRRLIGMLLLVFSAGCSAESVVAPQHPTLCSYGSCPVFVPDSLGG